MKLDIKDIIFFLNKKSFLILIVCFIFVILIFRFVYWKYIESLSQADIGNIKIENKLNKSKLEFLIKDIEDRKKSHDRSVQIIYNNPFNRGLN